MSSSFEARDLIANDPHRPQFHFSPPMNWMNDPNGLIQWNGQYHLFYQYNPEEAAWGNIHWGHAISIDLVHWQDLPIALTPSEGPDHGGCWSGCAINNDGIPTLLYTGVSPEVQCLATGSPDLRKWEKSLVNPVIGSPPTNMEVNGFRDPCIWREDNFWMMALGSGTNEDGGTVLLYRSENLTHWDYIGPLYEHGTDEFGSMWECPAFFPLGNKHILIISVYPNQGTIYAVGDYVDYKFIPEKWQAFDHGSCYYAPQTFLDDQNRRIAFGWLWEDRTEAAQLAAKWAGALSIPRVLALSTDNQLITQPAIELQQLRGTHYAFEDTTITPESTTLLNGIQGDCLEIKLDIVNIDSVVLGLRFRSSSQSQEYTELSCYWHERVIKIDRARSSTAPDIDRTTVTMSLPDDSDNALTLHIFVDRSILEVFADNRASLSTRIYPTRTDCTELEIFTQDGTVTCQQLNIWKINTIWQHN